MTHNLPTKYVDFLNELAALCNEPNVTNLALNIGLSAEDMDEPNDSTWIQLGCIEIEQECDSGVSTLWHSYSDGPYGNPANPEFFEGTDSIGGWPLEGDSNHYREHNVDTFTWSLISALSQALNGDLDSEHNDSFCSGLDDEFGKALRGILLNKLETFTLLDCDCGAFAVEQNERLTNQLSKDL